MIAELKYNNQLKRLDKAKQRIEELKNKNSEDRSYYEAKISFLESELEYAKMRNLQLTSELKENEILINEWKERNKDLFDKYRECQVLINQLKKLRNDLFKQ